MDNQESNTFQRLQGLQIEPSNANDNYYGTHLQKPTKTVPEQINTQLRTLSEEEWNDIPIEFLGLVSNYVFLSLHFWETKHVSKKSIHPLPP